MAESEGSFYSDSRWPTQNAPLILQQTLQQQSHKFQAFRDWNWFHSAPTNSWPPNPGCSVSSGGAPAYVQHFSFGNACQYGRQDYGQNQWRKKQKNHKEPEFNHFCDTCDRGFKNQDKYNEHIAQHVKCSFEDCKYTAHEKLVKIHWKNSHAPGAKRIKLDTPEEIAKWRAERRRNYPTQSNIQKKIKLMEVKEKRGDVLDTSQFGRFKSCGRVHGGQGFQTHGGNARGGHQHFHLGRENVEQASPLLCPTQDVDPLGALATSDPDSEKEESIQAAVFVAPKNLTSALGSLICSYGEDMTESDEEIEDSSILKKENKALLSAHSAPNRHSAQKHEKRQTIKESKIGIQVPYPQSHLEGCGVRGRRRGRQNDLKTDAQKCQPTLLEMLLAPDIRHERNVLLQCIRYIIHEEFFGRACKEPNIARPEVVAAVVGGNGIILSQK